MRSTECPCSCRWKNQHDTWDLNPVYHHHKWLLIWEHSFGQPECLCAVYCPSWFLIWLHTIKKSIPSSWIFGLLWLLLVTGAGRGLRWPWVNFLCFDFHCDSNQHLPFTFNWSLCWDFVVQTWLCLYIDACKSVWQSIVLWFLNCMFQKMNPLDILLVLMAK